MGKDDSRWQMRNDLEKGVELGKLLIEKVSQDQESMVQRGSIIWEPDCLSERASMASSSLSTSPAEDDGDIYSTLKAGVAILHELNCAIQWMLSTNT